MRERTHPVVIFSNLWRVFYLIVIPVLRGFISALRQDFWAWASGAWIDIIIFLYMLAIAVLQWHFMIYSYDAGIIGIRSGVFFKRETRISHKNISSISIVEPYYLRIFGICCLRADTLGGSHKDADLKIYIKKAKAGELMALLAENGWNESLSNRDSTVSYDKSAALSHGDISSVYVPRSRSILALSLLTSNSFAGIVFIATLISQSGKLLGNEFSNMILITFEDIARMLAFGIPPAAAAIAYALLVGWLIGFISNYISYRNFTLERREREFRIKGGLATIREYHIGRDRVNYLDIRTNAASMIFGLRSLYISSIGCGKHKDDISCVIPAEKENAFTSVRERIFSDFAFKEPEFKAPARGIMRFIGPALVLCVFFPALAVTLVYFFPSWSSFLLYTCLMLLAPSVSFLVIRVIAFRMGGMVKSGDYYTLRYSSGFSLHTVIIPADKIVSVSFRQTFFQARSKHPTCNVTVCAVAEGYKPHVCVNIGMEDAVRLFG